MTRFPESSLPYGVYYQRASDLQYSASYLAGGETHSKVPSRLLVGGAWEGSTTNQSNNGRCEGLGIEQLDRMDPTVHQLQWMSSLAHELLFGRKSVERDFRSVIIHAFKQSHNQGHECAK